jgi:hypothetical protein
MLVSISRCSDIHSTCFAAKHSNVTASSGDGVAMFGRVEPIGHRRIVGCMVRSRVSADEDGAIPLLGVVLGCFALMSGVFLLLYWLLQPVKVANLGLAVYAPPPSTHLEPLPRKMDAPEVAELAPLSPQHALAMAPSAVAESPPKQEVRPPAVPKRQRAKPRREPQPYGYAYSGWNGGWNSGRGYDRQWQGGFRSWW